jgi:hypothetical protein
VQAFGKLGAQLFPKKDMLAVGNVQSMWAKVALIVAMPRLASLECHAHGASQKGHLPQAVLHFAQSVSPGPALQP